VTTHVRYRGAGRWRRFVPIVLALSCAGGAAGVVSRPALRLDRVREKSATLERRTRAVDLRRDELERFEAADGFARLEHARARIDVLFPRDPSSIEQHAALRLLARELGIELDTLRFGGDVDAGLESLDDRILRRDVRVGGRSRPGALIDFVAGIRALGTPVVVLEARLAREDATATDFEFLLRLGLLHATDPAPAASWEEGP